MSTLPPLPEPQKMMPPHGRNFVGFVLAYSEAQMRAYALEALRLAVPQGWKLVPIVPTLRMIQDACDCQDADPEDGPYAEMAAQYAAMLAVAPSPPMSLDEASKGNGG